MKIETSGVVFIGECEIQSPDCVALTPAPVSAVFTTPQRRQINVCRPCIEYMVRSGEWEIPNARIPGKSDHVIYDASRHPLVVLEEVQIPPHEQRTPRAWATRVHRNLLKHGAITNAPYFMLVAPGHAGYLWSQGNSEDAGSEPSFEIDLATEFPGASGLSATALLPVFDHLLRDALSDTLIASAHPWIGESGILSRFAASQNP